MKNQFPGYFKLTKKDLGDLWENGLIVLDANILLNLYRYSEKTRKEFEAVLKKYKSQLWLPHQVGQEYFNNRLSVVSSESKEYDKAVKSIDELKVSLTHTRRHPFLKKATLDRTLKLFDTLNEELETNKAKLQKKYTDDDRLRSISSIYGGKIGEPYSKDEYEAAFKAGEVRYKNKIPPGYRDASKIELSPEYGICGKYGDLVLWQQIIDEAKKSSKGVIFVTDDKKEDWWELSSGKTIGARPELKSEFLNETGKKFHMYTPEVFLEFANDYLSEGEKEVVSKESIKEVGEVKSFSAHRSYSLPRVTDSLPWSRESEINNSLELMKNLRIFETPEYRKNYEILMKNTAPSAELLKAVEGVNTLNRAFDQSSEYYEKLRDLGIMNFEEEKSE